VADALHAVRALVSNADSASAAQMSGPTTSQERAAWLVGLRQIVDAAEVAFTQVLADFDAAGDGEALHAAASTQAWLRGALGMAGVEASNRVQIARSSRAELAPALASVLPSHPEAAEPPPVTPPRVSPPHISGVSYEHVRSIHRTLRALPPSAREQASETLTGIASQLGVDDLRASGRYLQHVVDPDGSARHVEEDFGRRWLSLAPMLDGVHSVAGVLDAETAARLQSALAPFLVPSGPDDTRTTDQRRADGLSEIVQTAVKSGSLPVLSGSSVALQIEVPLLALTGAAPNPARLSTTAKTPVWFSPDTTQRMSCDASVRRLLLDPTGIPLDLGRESRVFSPAQRKAFTTRDQGCRFPGCGRPPAHTDAHHLTHWAQGGATNLANGLLLCRYHHRQVHEGGWTITAAASPKEGANGPLIFMGPGGQKLPSPVPTALGPAP
jgi:hypothetical protein